MASTRGVDLLDAARFVRETYGPAAHEKVVEALAPGPRAIFEERIQEQAWYPLEALRDYLRFAKELLAPHDERFFRNQGFHAGQRQKAGPVGVMVADPYVRMRLAPTTWRLFYDVGRLVVAGDTPADAVGQIHDFPASPELCERFCGIWEGLATTPENRARAEETKCVLRGDPCCEIRLTYEPSTFS